MVARSSHLLGAERPVQWSRAAFVLAVAGVAAATWVVLGSDGDSSHVRWWLVVAPTAICLVPLLLPLRGVRIGAAVTLAAWCVLATLSIGFLLWPALVSLVVAAREGS